VLHATARALVEGEFPATLIPDVLTAVGLDADAVYGTGVVSASPRRRSSSWSATILGGWDRQCAFCGSDGRLGSGSVGGRPRTCGGSTTRVLVTPTTAWHRARCTTASSTGGVLGLSDSCRLQVSSAYSARTPTGRDSGFVFTTEDRHPCDPRNALRAPTAAAAKAGLDGVGRSAHTSALLRHGDDLVLPWASCRTEDGPIPSQAPGEVEAKACQGSACRSRSDADAPLIRLGGDRILEREGGPSWAAWHPPLMMLVGRGRREAPPAGRAGAAKRRS
jgi:hypothetical protein